jgi:membrane protein DedA with SNARE-associated domain
MLHSLLTDWFHLVENWGYLGVFFLMALESSIVPVPSEVVMPPAAFWAAQGRMSFAGVVLAGTLGSYVGSAVSYWISLWVGRPIVARFGKYAFISVEKLALAENWIARFGTPGIFFARLLPVIRHLISIPAGICRMPFLPFSTATALGAGLWCLVLSWYGRSVIGDHPELLNSPEDMVHVIKSQMIWIIAAVVALAAAYFLMVKIGQRRRTA